ncbi:MAG: hypothetical protein Kow0022_05840 [Phycisphaerales bacterium]
MTAMGPDLSHEQHAAAVASLLRSIPERWADFDHDALAATEQRALFLLVAAGLVERRIGVRGEFAGQAPAIEFTIDATGEYGIVEALDPVVAEMWTKWGPAFEAWKAGDAKNSTPFRFTRTGLDRWRLTESGVMARADLDIEAPSPAAAAVVGSYQRVIEYVTRTGHQTERPGVRGEGRLVETKICDAGEDAKPTPAPVSLANSEELAAAFRDMVVPAMAEALRGFTGSTGVPVSETPAGTAGNEGFGEVDAEVEVPPLTENEVAVITTLVRFDPVRLASVAMIEAEMDAGSRRSPRKIGEAVNRLIELGFAERPRGDRSGVRLTIAGRRIARKIAD